MLDGTFAVAVPDGESGLWKVSTFNVEARDAAFFNLRAARDGGMWATIQPGTYKRLTRGHTVVMSNTPMEWRTNLWVIQNAKGRVLLNGLGLGASLKAILDKPEVTEVWVVENSEDVIKLVWPTYSQHPKAKLIKADALEWTPPKGAIFDVVWHDIWDDITTDNLVQMTKLHRKYARRCVKQDSWTKDILRARKRAEKREESRWL